LFLIWSNADSRAFLGMALVVLQGLGEVLTARRKPAVAPTSGSGKTFWQAAAASLVAMLVHPFGYRSLLAPFLVYGAEYPAFREYYQGTYRGIPLQLAWPGLSYFPITTGSFWTQIDLASAAALAMLAIAFLMFILNWKNLDPAHVIVYLGCLVFAAVSLHELPWAALVCAVLATLNGQAWYAANCRQTYSIETSELVFSRGGRALTVVAFAAIALFGGTGRMRDVRAPRTGYGVDHTLGSAINDFRNQLIGERSFDHRPFNQSLAQGDILIWIGEKVFADNRVGVYYHPIDGRNLLRTHWQTREALHFEGGANGGSGKGRAWKPVFDDYEITHAILRLGADTNALSEIELLGLLFDEDHWQLTSLGPSAAVVYRRDIANAELGDFAADHAVDFKERAYREEGPEIIPRDQRARPPSFYQRYFWSKKRELEPEVQEALHLVRLVSLPLPPRYDETDQAAMALLAIRLAQAGLSKNPDSADGYLALGQAYQFLADFEARHAFNELRSPSSGTRYLQAVIAYNQALLADPDSQTAHVGLYTLYQRAGRPELTLIHQEALERLLAKRPDVDRDQLTAIKEQINRLSEQTQFVEDELARAPQGEAGLQLRIGTALSRGCLLLALRDLDEQANLMNSNVAVERLRIGLLLEAGRIDDALEAAQRFASVAAASGLTDWASLFALANLSEANYAGALEAWERETDQIASVAMSNTLQNLGFHSSDGMPWPLGTLRTAVDFLYSAPENIAYHELEMGLVALEAGQLTAAEEHFRATLRANSESSNRILAAYYLFELTGERSDLLPPSENVPGAFSPESDAPEEKPLEENAQ
jgi:tetratricopeptide (TPR) repeat protein